MNRGIVALARSGVIAAALTLYGIALESGATAITNAGSGDWFISSTWNPAQVPSNGDDVVISSGSVLLTNQTDQLATFNLTGGTLVMSNWMTRLRATTVTITNTGTITLPGAFTNNAMSNRVWISCTDLSIEPGAKIDVDGKGWSGALGGATGKNGHGPGAGIGQKASAGYGGYGTIRELQDLGGGLPYGSAAAPTDPGSGGSGYGGAGDLGGAGGGAVRIEADAGRVLINGTITANGKDRPTGGTFANPGSGGSIYITCRTFTGTSGVIRADGVSGASSYASSGGGRIAVVYNATDQAGLSVPSVSFSTARGAAPANREGDIGTIYLTDRRFLKDLLTGFTGQVFCSTSAELGFFALTVSNAWVRFPQDSIRLIVTNDLKVLNGGILEIGANALSTNCIWDRADSSGFDTRFRLLSEMATNPVVECLGNMVLTNGGVFRIYAGMTNSAAQTGALVKVTGAMTIAANSWLYPVSHGTNGGSVYLQVGGLTVMAGGGINADGCGFAPPFFLPTSIEAGLGYGNGRKRRSGAGHGGTGGEGDVGNLGGGYSYGDSNTPVHAGSSGGRYPGGGNQYWAGAGGGAIRVDARGAAVQIDGTLSARGGRSSTDSGAGSGGSIYLQCRSFAGLNSGVIRADGGSPWVAVTKSASGGGGRIAVMRFPSLDTYAGTYSVSYGTNATYTGTVGTVVMLADPNIPTVSNTAPVNFDADSADMVGFLSSTGASPTEVYCYWGTNDGAMVKANWMTNDYISFRGVGYHTNAVINLSATTKYYYRFYATNSSGDGWAPTTTNFTTTGGFIVNNGSGATALTPMSAKLRGEVIASPTPDVYICWGASDVPADSTGLWDHVEYAGTLTGSFEKDIAGLLANKTYYYRCFATNSGGWSWAPVSTNFATTAPDLAIADDTVTESGPGDSPVMEFIVSLSATSATPVSVQYATSNGTASAGSDFAGASGTLTIPAGIVSTSIAVTVTGDATDEFPYETFYIVLSNATDAAIADGIARGTITDEDDEAGTKVWNGTGEWDAHGNWSPFGQPSPSDTVIVQSGSLVLPSPQSIAALVVSNSATMVFTNWSTKLTVGGMVEIRSNATITLPAAYTNGGMSNRVWIVCSTLTVQPWGKIDADGRGFAGGSATYGFQNGFGPGAGLENKSAGGYGGAGGRQEPMAPGGSLPYGTASAPEAPGSGGGSATGVGNYGGAGGGAVRIEASGGVTVEGTITANGSGAVYGGGAGSGGGIYITCATISGGGTVRADGAYGGAMGGGIHTRSGGGRIAVDYNSSAQALIAVPAIGFSARTPPDGGPDSAPGDLGTLYFPDERLLTRNPLTGLTGQWHSASANLNFSQLTVSNAWLRFVKDSIRMTVTNNLLLETNGWFEIGGNAINSNVWWDRRSLSYWDSLPRPMSEMSAGPALTCGSLTITNGGALWVYAGLTNATTGTGATVHVSGMLTVASNAWIYPVSHATNGGSVAFILGGLRLQPGGGINADASGFACKANYLRAGAFGTGAGYGYQSTGGSGIGGGYGGLGGNAQSIYGQTYGSSNIPPFYCGSGGGGESPAGAYRGGSGGGFIRIDAAASDILIDGIVRANGGKSWALSGAGSGGGIHITCRRWTGSGAVLANGGCGSVSNLNGTGGGGRIAIFRRSEMDTFTGSGSYSVLAGTNGVKLGADGTLHLGENTLPPAGTAFIIR